ncbi:MAG TPA: DNA recombination protein RmuC [Actinomycetes bacterium]|nr:DNA recombination protein RmuC [Actinomycetes bacterium]
MDLSSLTVGLVLGIAIGALGGIVLATWWANRTQPPQAPPLPVSDPFEVDRMVRPVSETLARVEQHLATAEQQRNLAHGELREQVKSMGRTSDLLRTETQALVTALRAPQVRGRWGELQLRRVVELAGLVEHCDFSEQVTVMGDDGRLRPDLVVHLAGGKNVVVDSKVPFAGYVEAMNSEDETVIQARLVAHARHLRAHIDELSGKAYWQHLSPAPEFVVLFVPAEPFLSAALDQDPALLEYAFERNVVLATPNTLVALLRTVGYAWRQEALTANAQQVLTLGKELHSRLGVMGTHMTKLGNALDSTVKSFNQTVGSLESRVLVTARRFTELKVSDGELATPAQIDLAPRLPQAAELIDVAEISRNETNDTPQRAAG